MDNIIELFLQNRFVFTWLESFLPSFAIRFSVCHMPLDEFLIVFFVIQKLSLIIVVRFWWRDFVIFQWFKYFKLILHVYGLMMFPTKFLRHLWKLPRNSLSPLITEVIGGIGFTWIGLSWLIVRAHWTFFKAFIWWLSKDYFPFLYHFSLIHPVWDLLLFLNRLSLKVLIWVDY